VRFGQKANLIGLVTEVPKASGQFCQACAHDRADHYFTFG
jgi:hypothetical protein